MTKPEVSEHKFRKCMKINYKIFLIKKKITERERKRESLCKEKIWRRNNRKSERKSRPGALPLVSLVTDQWKEGEREIERNREEERGEVFAGVLFYFSFPCCETLPSLFFSSFVGSILFHPKFFFFSLSLSSCLLFLSPRFLTH